MVIIMKKLLTKSAYWVIIISGEMQVPEKNVIIPLIHHKNSGYISFPRLRRGKDNINSVFPH